jgi:hypothetical protein
VDNNPGTECRRHNGRLPLLAHVKKFYLDNYSIKLTEPKLNAKVSGLLSQQRPGIIKPEYTSKGKKQKSLGAPGAYSKVEKDKLGKKWNPVTNKKASQKRKAANDAKNRATTVSQGLQHTMRDEAETKLLCERLHSIKKYAILGNQTMSKAIETKSHAIYIGTTGRALKEEDLRWLTERGAQDQGNSRSGLVVYKGRRNRPVLLKEEGKCITPMGEARRHYGAKSVVISNSRLRLNETNLEDALQRKLHPTRLGPQRLHRHVAMGDKQAAKATEERKDPDFLAKTFMTCLPVMNFDKTNTHRPKWVEFKDNKRLKVDY